MTWEYGAQIPRKNDFITNEELLKKEGFLEEREAKLLFYQFLRNNTTFATDLLMGVKLFPFQHMAIKGMLESDYFLGIWCLEENEYVLTENGFKKIKDVQIGERVRSRKSLNNVSDKKTNPEEDGLEISLASGDSFKAKIGHKTLVYNTQNGQFEFKEIQHLTCNDHLPVKTGTEVWGNKDITSGSDYKRSPYMFYTFGYILGDGWVNIDGIHYCSENLEIQERISVFIKENDLKSYWRQKTDNLNFYEYSAFDRKFVKWLQSLGWDITKKSREKIIPDILLQASRNELCALIGGVFDADGYASIGNGSNKVGLKNSSLELLRQIKMLLNNLGITSFLRKSGVHKSGPYYDLVISNDHDSLQKFQDSIGFIVYHKRDNLAKIVELSKKRNYQNNLVPDFGKILRAEGGREKISGKRGGWGKSFSQNEFDTLKNISDETQQTIEDIKNEQVVFSKIKSIDKCKVVSVDITVDNEENYVGNGIVHHNSRGLSKCSRFDSLVWTEKGLKRMIDIEVDDHVQSLNSVNKVVDKTINPKQTSYKIETQSGFISEGLDYHRILTLNKDLDFEWKFNKDIELDDVVVIKKQFDLFKGRNIFDGFEYQSDIVNPNKPRNLILREEDSADWFYFFGLLLGDGCMVPNVGIKITSCDQEIVDFLRSFAANIGLNTVVLEKIDSKAYEISINSVQLYQFLIWLGFEKSKAHQKYIPQKLTLNSKDRIKELIRGLFDTDGYASYQERKKKNAKNVRIGFTSSSELLIDQVQNLLLQFGITASKKITFKGGNAKFGDKYYYCNKAWSLIACNKKDVTKYKENIGFLIQRKMDVLNALDDQKYQEAVFSDTIPYVGDFLEEKFGKKSICVGKGKDKGKFNFRKNTPKRLLKNIIASGRVDDIKEKLSELLREDISFEKVISTSVGECITVDITVENEHNYISNGIVNHNSFSTGIFAVLDSIFNQGIATGILSKSFRQSKLIFKKIEDIAAKPEAYLLRQAITKVTKNNDEWVMEIGRSRIHALPLGDGEKLRGFRFQRIIIDELLLMPERIYNEVIVPFLSVVENPTQRDDLYKIESELIAQGKMREEDRFQWPHNKLIGLSSASYKFEYLYKLFQQYENLIINPQKDDTTKRCIMQLSYDCAPMQLYDRNLINQAKATMSESQFSREFGALFTDESDSYFKLSKMIKRTIPDGEMPSVEVSGDPSCEYIVSIDPSWSETESSDDFAMQVLKLDNDKEFATLVHSFALSGSSLKDHMKYFLFLLQNFNIVGIVMDYNGGVQFMNSCNESELFKTAGIQLKQLTADFDKPEEYNQDLLKAKQEYNKTDYKYVILRKPTSAWIRLANELLQASLDHGKIFFASRAVDNNFRAQAKRRIGIQELKFSNLAAIEAKQTEEALMIDFIEHLSDMISMTKTQCALIQITTTSQGTQTFDLPYNLRRQNGPDKARKDSYSALVLGNWMAKVYFDMKHVKKEDIMETFVPFSLG